MPRDTCGGWRTTVGVCSSSFPLHWSQGSNSGHWAWHKLCPAEPLTGSSNKQTNKLIMKLTFICLVIFQSFLSVTSSSWPGVIHMSFCPGHRWRSRLGIKGFWLPPLHSRTWLASGLLCLTSVLYCYLLSLVVFLFVVSDNFHLLSDCF